MLQLVTSKPKNKYESLVIMHPDASEEQQKQLFKKNLEILKSFNGEFSHVDTWGKRRLANSIKKLTRGHYFHTTFESEAGAIAELERTMKNNESVLRFVHIKLDSRLSLKKYVEQFYEHIKDVKEKEKEIKAKVKVNKKK